MVLVLPNLVRDATVIGLAAFLVLNAFLGVKQKRFAVALAFLAVAVFVFIYHGPAGLTLAYVAVFSAILWRSMRTDITKVTPAYILFGHEESRYFGSGFRSRM